MHNPESVTIAFNMLFMEMNKMPKMTKLTKAEMPFLNSAIVKSERLYLLVRGF